ncbi:hypothetical protein MCEMRE26_00146 [Candidatus Nanopelagicaceae bacterium]
MKTPWLIFMLIACSWSWYKYDSRRKKIIQEFPGIFSKPESELESIEIFRINTDKGDRKFFGGIALTSLVISVWAGSWLPYKAEEDASQQLQSFIAGYATGWDGYCDEIFDFSLGSVSTNGYLYAGSYAYDSGWCKGMRLSGSGESSAQAENILEMAPYSSVESAKQKGENLGYRDSREKVFSKVPYLCYGSECISADSELSRNEDLAQQQWEYEQQFNDWIEP